MINLIKPAPIKPGDTVYVISPSAGIMPFAENRVKRSKKNLEKLGLKVKIAPNANKNDGYVSSSVENRVSDIHCAFRDENCSLIIAAIGGNHSNQLLKHLDYELIKKNPKTFVGYSDNTVLHLGLMSQAGLQTVYGPCFLNQFGENPEPFEYTMDDFTKVVINKIYPRKILPSEQYTDEILDWFKNEDAKRPRKQKVNLGWEWWQEGKSSGWALPVAIPSINHVLTTKYMPDVTGAVLMIDIPEGGSMYEGMSVADVDSWMTDLSNAEVLSKINALVISRPYRYSAATIAELKKVIDRITHDLEIPVLFNIDFGHTDPMISIPYGTTIRLDSNKNSFEFI